MILLIFLLLIDAYAFVGLMSLAVNTSQKWLVASIFIVLSLIGYFGIYKSIELFQTNPINRSELLSFLSGFAFVLVASKLVFVILLLLQDIGRFSFGGLQHLFFWLTDSPGEVVSFSRRQFVTAASAGIAAIPFVSLLYGITFGKYRFTVENVSLAYDDLPPSFHGLRIAQISDAHAGSWDSVAEVRRGIQIIQDLNPDLIVFTGDLVNRHKDEIDPFIEAFGELQAPLGKFAILGNHDYYGNPSDPDDRKAYWDDFYSKYDAMGFEVLLNSNASLHRNSDVIRLLGVENWGQGRWFPKRGDLSTSLNGCGENDFCILLSHDPTHWSEKVLPHHQKIHLTLSGHTHGMQFGINLPGFKWSPVQYRYKHWMGLYEEEGQRLYVNRGFGYLAFPGRVGMWPEITLIELQKTAAV